MIKEVIIFANGMVAAFDEKGEQFPEAQGFILEVGEKLQTLCDEDTKFFFGISEIGKVECHFNWWFNNHRGTPTGF
jgi:hypothetical protein